MATFLIVEDEHLNRQVIAAMATSFFPEGQCIGMAEDLAQARALLSTQKPDVVFLDIQLPDGTGFDLLRQLPQPLPFAVIILTAYEQYALQAFEYGVLDYLLKPIHPQHFQRAITRWRNTLQTLPAVTPTKDDLREDEIQQGMQLLRQDRLLLMLRDEIIAIDLPELLRCEADQNYTRFYLTDKSVLISARPLLFYEKILEPTQLFLRIHQKHLVQQRAIKRFMRGTRPQVELKDGTILEVSHHRKTEVLKQFLG